MDVDAIGPTRRTRLASRWSLPTREETTPWAIIAEARAGLRHYTRSAAGSASGVEAKACGVWVCGCVGVCVCGGGGLSPRAHKISDFNHSDMAEKRVWHLSLLL